MSDESNGRVTMGILFKLIQALDEKVDQLMMDSAAGKAERRKMSHNIQGLFAGGTLITAAFVFHALHVAGILSLPQSALSSAGVAILLAVLRFAMGKMFNGGQ